jgi:hypothetical protein
MRVAEKLAWKGLKMKKSVGTRKIRGVRRVDFFFPARRAS